MTAKRVFISYKREDRPRVKNLAEDLQRADNTVWYDESLQVGDHWWDTILEQIEQCDVFVFAISQRALRSIPCQRERAYAAALGKPMLLIQVGALTAVPTEYATIQFEDFSKGDPLTLIDLIGGINRLTPHEQPLPPNVIRPAAPIAPIEEIAAILDTQADIELKDQAAILFRLKETLGDPQTRTRALELIAGLLKKTQFVEIEEEARAMLAANKTALHLPAFLPIISVIAVIAVMIGIGGILLTASRNSATPTASNTPIPSTATSYSSASTNMAWTPITKTFSDGVEMVLVPKGCFMMGSTDFDTVVSDAQPVAKICFDQPYWIDKTDVTNEQFTRLNGVASSAGHWMDSKRPRDSATWVEARDFCANARGARLPTEAEWEYAARGPSSWTYPWGNETPTANKAVYSEDSGNQTADVGSKPDGASWVGALDMAGNVLQWTSTVYDASAFPYPYKAADGRENTIDVNAAKRVLRGGSWSSNVTYLRSAVRFWLAPMSIFDGVGFRCVRAF